MCFMHGGDNLPKEYSGMGFPQPPPGPHIRMEVGGAGWEEEVTKFVPNNHFLQRIDMGMTVHTVVGC